MLWNYLFCDLRESESCREVFRKAEDKKMKTQKCRQSCRKSFRTTSPLRLKSRPKSYSLWIIKTVKADMHAKSHFVKGWEWWQKLWGMWMILIILLMLTCTQITECPQNQMRRGHGGHNTDDHDLGGIWWSWWHLIFDNCTGSHVKSWEENLSFSATGAVKIFLEQWAKVFMSPLLQTQFHLCLKCTF